MNTLDEKLIGVIHKYRRRQMTLFLVGVVALGLTSGLYESSFSNFLKDIYDLSASERGMLEFPRELPGFLVAFFIGSLFFMSESRIAAMASVFIGLGLVGLAWCVLGLPMGMMIVFMVTWSIGNHLIMPMRRSLAMTLARREGKGRLLGKVNGLTAWSAACGAGVVWLVCRFIEVDYILFFGLAAASTVVAAIAFGSMRLPHANKPRPKWIFRKKYGLFYGLTLLWGDRKQVFLTFGPWLLISEFKQGADTIAMLMLISWGLGGFVQPMLGRLVDRLGSRKLLMADGIGGVAVCMVYAFAPFLRQVDMVSSNWFMQLSGADAALYAIMGCYVLDHLLVGLGMARVTYLSDIVEHPRELAPTLSVGVTLDHFTSMFAPILAGTLWKYFGYQYAFLYASCLACVTFTIACRIPKKQSL
jgi:hypothetical protein